MPLHYGCTQPDKEPDTKQHCSACGSDPSRFETPDFSVEALAEPLVGDEVARYASQVVMPVSDVFAATTLHEAPPETTSSGVSEGPDDSATLPETMSSPSPAAEFRRKLKELTPWVCIVPIVIGVNVLLFVLMTNAGVSDTSPEVQEIFEWGGNFGPKTIGGQWWRILTCTFVHYGTAHLMTNMAFLLVVGCLVERMLGNCGFLVIYLLSALGGTLVSLFWNPMYSVGAGASGAIFGVYGALLALLLLRYRSIPVKTLTKWQKVALGLILLDVFFGFFVPAASRSRGDGSFYMVDIAAHLGGFMMGFFVASMLSQPFTHEARAGRRSRNVAVGAAGTFIIVVGMISLRAYHAEVVQVDRELERFYEVEKKSLDACDLAEEKAEKQELTYAALADLIERDVLPEWRAVRGRLSALKQLPEDCQRIVTPLLEYIRVRQEHWEFLVPTLRLYSENVQAQNDLEQFQETKRKAIVAFNTALEKSKRQELTDAAFADLIEHDVLPEWRAALQKVSAFQHVPENGHRHFVSFLGYMRLRQEGWELLVQSLREPTEQNSKLANDKQVSANAAGQNSSEALQGLIESLHKAGEKRNQQAAEKGKRVDEALERLQEIAGTPKRQRQK